MKARVFNTNMMKMIEDKAETARWRRERWKCCCQTDCKVEMSFWDALFIVVCITVNEVSLGDLHY